MYHGVGEYFAANGLGDAASDQAAWAVLSQMSPEDQAALVEYKKKKQMEMIAGAVGAGVVVLAIGWMLLKK